MSTHGREHGIVIDPARHTPELAGFNRLARSAPLPLTYHLPAMHGMQSLLEEDMSTARALIILGSASSVNERSPWQLTLEDWLRPHLLRGVPTFGICYGHQMLAYMFGGEVAYMFADQRKHLGQREVNVAATPCWAAARGPLIVSHNEMVVRAPKSMTVLAHSEAVAIDGLAHKTLPIWSLQAHPEATTDFLLQHQLDPATFAGNLGFGYQLLASFLAYAAAPTRTQSHGK